MREDVEAAGRAPVRDAHGVAVADLDEAELLEPLDRLADAGHVDAERGGERALRRQLLPREVAVGQQRLEQRREDAVGDQPGKVFGTLMAHKLPESSEQWGQTPLFGTPGPLGVTRGWA